MTTTGTTNFNLDINSLIEESFEMAGAELRTGYDFRTARRSINLLTIEWINAGINLFTIEQGEIPLVQGQITYDLPVNTIDLLDHVVRTGTGQNQTDINISRISESTYLAVPNKNAQGRPIQVWVDRQSGATTPDGVQYPQIRVWPTPEQSDFYTFVYFRLKRIEDAGSGSGTMDIPFRFLPALAAGLAYKLSLKLPGGLERSDRLKMEYEAIFANACAEDREKAPMRAVPRQMFI